MSGGGQRRLRARCNGGSRCKSLSVACAPSRSRRNSSMRARMVAKSSAARVRFTSPPPSAWVEFGGRSIVCIQPATPIFNVVNIERQRNYAGPGARCARLGCVNGLGAYYLRGRDGGWNTHHLRRIHRLGSFGCGVGTGRAEPEPTELASARPARDLRAGRRNLRGRP